MNRKAIEKTELNKILALVSEFAVLDGGKEKIRSLEPVSDLAVVRKSLSLTEEAVELLFHHGISKIERFEKFSDELKRAKKGSTLSCGELLLSASLLRSTRIAHTSISGVNDENIKGLKAIADNLYFDVNLEEDILSKILNDSEVSDYASDKLFSLRKEIRTLNERIRSRLGEYLTGSEAKYLQDLKTFAFNSPIYKKKIRLQ